MSSKGRRAWPSYGHTWWFLSLKAQAIRRNQVNSQSRMLRRQSLFLCRLPPAFAGISASTPGALAVTGRDRNEKVAIKQAAAEEQKHEREVAVQKDTRECALSFLHGCIASALVGNLHDREPGQGLFTD